MEAAVRNCVGPVLELSGGWIGLEFVLVTKTLDRHISDVDARALADALKINDSITTLKLRCMPFVWCCVLAHKV